MNISDDDDKYNLISPSTSSRINNKNTPQPTNTPVPTSQLQKKSSEISLPIRSSFPTPPSPIMSSRDTSLPQRQKVEELQKKLKEELDVKAQLLKNAQVVLVDKKQLREHYLNLVKEKDALEESYKMMQKANEGVSENYPAGHLFKLKNELESLRREKEELNIKLKEKQDQEAREKESKKNEFPQKSPELISKLEENEKLRNQIGVVEKEKLDLENQRAEAQQQQSLHSQNEFHEQQENSECFFICAEDARILALKIKKMQQELWDLGVKHQQLVVNHHHLTTKLDEERQKVMGSAQESNPPVAQEEKDEKELEEDREKKEEIWYRTLSESLFSLQIQVKTAIINDELTEVIVETIKKALENIPLEQRPGTELNDSVKRVSDESEFKKLGKRVSSMPLKPKQKTQSKISKKKTGQYYSKKKEKKGEKEED